MTPPLMNLKVNAPVAPPWRSGLVSWRPKSPTCTTGGGSRASRQPTKTRNGSHEMQEL